MEGENVNVILMFMMTVFGIMVLGAGFLIYDIITAIREFLKNR